MVRIPEDLMMCAENLSPLGLDELAWPPGDAIKVLQFLDEAGVAVLGGDVYRRQGMSFEPTYENWYVDKADSESIEDFSRRSHIVARNFIGGLTRRDCWVSLVCSEPLGSGNEMDFE